MIRKLAFLLSTFCLLLMFGLNFNQNQEKLFLKICSAEETSKVENSQSGDWFSQMLDKISKKITGAWNQVWGVKSDVSKSEETSKSGETNQMEKENETKKKEDKNEKEDTSEGLESWWQSLKEKILGANSTTVPKPSTTTNQPTKTKTSQNNSNPTPFEDQTQQPQEGESASGPDNGSQKLVYDLEPNQFKKECGQNTYYLNWRKAGIEGTDMADPLKKGKPTGQKAYWILPTCEELAKCHCCCNKCLIPASLCTQQGWVFNDKGCVGKCSPVCEASCGSDCKKWDKPTPPDKAPLDSDCRCNVEGCPKPQNNECKIVIEDPGNTEVEYTTRDGNPEQYFKKKGPKVEFMNGNGKKDPKSKIISEGADTTERGWVMLLEDKPGVCCKCKDNKK